MDERREIPEYCQIHRKKYREKKFFFDTGNQIINFGPTLFCPECLIIPPSDTNKVRWSGFGEIVKIDNEYGILWKTMPGNQHEGNYSSIRFAIEGIGFIVPNLIKKVENGLFTPFPLNNPFELKEGDIFQFKAHYVK